MASRPGLVLFSLALSACHPRTTALSPSTTTQAAEVERALARYEAFTLAMAHDSLAAMFASDGILAAAGQPDVVGPAAIAAHLRAFVGFRVLADSLHADSTRIEQGRARQVGTYWQRVRVPQGDTVEVRGRFEAEWVRVSGVGWRLRRLATSR